MIDIQAAIKSPSITPPGEQGYTKRHCEFEDQWLCLTTYRFVMVSRLVPTDFPLEFNMPFLKEVMGNPGIEGLGIYCNGWEL